MKESVFFKKDDKIYKATKGASIENVTDDSSEKIAVSELFRRKDTTYGLVLFSTNDKWPIRAFDIDVIDL